jgi:hypothetical protein
LGFPAGTGHAQEAVVVSIEPARATVGDRLALTITVTHPAGVDLALPAGPEVFAPLEVLEVREPETDDAPDGERRTRFVFVLAAFEAGELRPPPLEILTATGEVFATAALPAVDIESTLPRDAALELRDLSAPLEASTGPPAWVWATLLMAGFAALTVATMALARIPTIERPEPVVPERPASAEDVARAELDAVAAAGHLDRGELLAYYSRIAACLRAYVSARFAVPATAMTPQELAARLEALDADRLAARLAVNMLEQCQAVQFAGYAPVRERAEADLAAAYAVVARTTPAEPVAKEPARA